MADAMTVFFAAVLVEALVNIVRNIEQKNTDWRYWAALGLAISVSILVTLNWDVDLFSILLGEGRWPFVGAVLTGIIVARGANIVADVLKLVNATTQRVKNGA